MKCVVTRTADDGLDALTGALHKNNDFEIVEIEPIGARIVPILTSDSTDMLIFPLELVDLIRAIRNSNQAVAGGRSRLVMTADPISVSVKALATLSGFHGVVESAGDADEARLVLNRVHEGSANLADDPHPAGLNLTPGMLGRSIATDDPIDREILNLIGLGLADDIISQALDISIQRVRNRVEHLLVSNDLAHRTQLAVIRAALLKVPDFA